MLYGLIDPVTLWDNKDVMSVWTVIMISHMG